MRHRAIVFLLLVSVATAAYFAYRWRRAEDLRTKTVRWTHAVMDSLSSMVTPPGPPVGPEGRDSVYWQWVATTAQLHARRWQEAVRHWAELRSASLDEADMEALRRQGLKNPANELRANLVTHQELIPFPGVHGGTMFIVPGDRIALLTPPYAFAEFDDGHVGGAMLLEYAILPGPQIQWKRLWATLE